MTRFGTHSVNVPAVRQFDVSGAIAVHSQEAQSMMLVGWRACDQLYIEKLCPRDGHLCGRAPGKRGDQQKPAEGIGSRATHEVRVV